LKYFLGALLKLYYIYLLIISNPKKLRRYITKKAAGYLHDPSSQNNQNNVVKVATVQIKARLYKNIYKYMDDMLRWVVLAKNNKCQFIALPEYHTLQLLGLLPGIGKQDSMGSKTDHNSSPSVLDILKYIAPIIERIYVTLFSTLAKLFDIYIMAGSTVVEDERLFNCGYLFDNEGNTIGKQRKVHLMPMEMEWGLGRSNDITVCQTGIGCISFPICMDATYYETFRIASLKGADIVVIPIANAEEYNHWKALRGTWPRVQESWVYGIKSAMVGTLLGFTFSGKAGIYAPIELTSNKDGIIAESKEPFSEDIIYGYLDINKIRQYKTRALQYLPFNTELIEKYLPNIYN
jgi:predicted amidohydrolase